MSHGARVLRGLAWAYAAAALLYLLEAHVWLGALLGELALHLSLAAALLAVWALKKREHACMGAFFASLLLFAAPSAALLRPTRLTPQSGPLVHVAHAHLAGHALSASALADLLGRDKADALALTGLRAGDASKLGKRFVGYRVQLGEARPLVSALLIRDTAHPGAHSALPAATLRAGSCALGVVVVDLPSLASFSSLAGRAARIGRLAREKLPSRSVWLGHFGSRSEASDLSPLLKMKELRDSRRGHGRFASTPAALGALGLPVDHVLAHGWLAVRERAADAPLVPGGHRTQRATLELTEPSCRPRATAR